MRATAANASPRDPAVERTPGISSATRTVVATFGVLAGLAGVEHGVGEIVQGSVRPDDLVIESWPDSVAFEALSGEPAMTLIPNLLVAGTVTIMVALALAIWAARYVDRRHGGLVLMLLSLLLLLVGGGFGPPLVGIICGIAATRLDAVGRRPAGRVSRALGRAWPWLLAVGVVGYLSLVPGAVLLRQFFAIENARLVYALSAVAFTGLILALITARAHDRANVASRYEMP